jgi:hypothetical protein
MVLMAPPPTPSGPTPTGAIIPDSAVRAVFITGQCVSGFCCLMSAIVSGLEAAEEDGDNALAIPSAVLGILGGVSSGVACALVPYEPVGNVVVADFSKAVLALRITCKIIFSGPAQKLIARVPSVKIQGLAVEDGRGVGAIVDAVLTLPGLFVSIWHFVELGEKSAGDTRSVSIVNEVGTVTSCVARIFYAVAVNTEAEVKAAAVAVHVIANVCNGGLLIADAMIGTPLPPPAPATAWRR